MQRALWLLGVGLVGGLTACSGGPDTGDASDAISDASDASDVVTDTVNEAGGDGGCEGTRRSFWTWDLTIMPPPDLEVDTGCRIETPHGALYSPDDVWPSPLGPTNGGAVMQAWEQTTPADPHRGIYTIDTSLFGDPPDVDHDPHVYLFYRRIGTFHGFTFDGYFRASDEDITDPVSNHAEMLHLNVGAQDVASEYMLGVVAHEFVHLIASQYGDEDVWLSESLAEGGMIATGYLGDVSLAQRFVHSPSSPLVTSSGGADYGPFFLFADYLSERYSLMILGEIARDMARGIPSVETALSHHGGGTFRDLFGDWTVANLIDAPHPPYGYAAFDVTTESAASTLTAGAGSTATLGAWSAGYFVIDLATGDTAADVSIMSATSANLVVHTALYDPTARGMATVATLPLSGATTTSTVTRGTAGSRLAIIVANASATPAPITLTATPH